MWPHDGTELKLHVFSYPFLSYVNRSSVEENETMSKCFAVHA